MTLRARQQLLAAFVTDPAVEARVREAPEASALVWRVTVEYARWLAGLDPRRVRAFRRSSEVKRRRRR